VSAGLLDTSVNSVEKLDSRVPGGRESRGKGAETEGAITAYCRMIYALSKGHSGPTPAWFIGG